MIFQHRYIKWGLLFFLAFSIIVGLNMVSKRHVFETKNQTVDMAMSLQDVNALSKQGGIYRSKLLVQLAKQVGFTSIVVDEDTLESFINDGKISMLRGSEIRNLLRIGRYRNSLVNYLKNKRVYSDRLYLAIDETAIYERVKSILDSSLEPRFVKEKGHNIIEVKVTEEVLGLMGFGLSSSVIKELTGYGFNIIPRFRNHQFLTESLIKLKFQTIAKQTDIHTILFEGDQLLGYPTQLGFVGDYLQQESYNFGRVEFTHQLGADELALQYPTSVIRVHMVSDDEMIDAVSSDLVIRYTRSVKERGNRLIVLRPFLTVIGEQSDLLIHNIHFFEQVKSQLESFDFTVEKIVSLPLDYYQPPTPLELFIMSLGLFVWCLILIDFLVPVSVFYFVGSFIVFSSISLMLYFNGFDILWSRFLTLVSTVVFPVFALVYFFPAEDTRQFGYRPLLVYLLKLLGICLIGAIFVVSFMSDISYLMGIRQFFGVKISFLLPLLIVGVYFYLNPYRIRSIYYVFRRLFYAPIRTSSLLAICVCLIFVGLYILRSGNYVDIPLLEIWMRNSLEAVMFVRPRTKEFLIGFPFLLLGFMYIDRYISRNWLWFFNVIGCIALISILNSFCHVHTPLIVSLYRTLLGFILGILFGLIYVVISRLFKKMLNRISG